MNSERIVRDGSAFGVLSLPGIKNARKAFCCVGCGIAGLGLDESFLLELLVHGTPVDAIQKCEEEYLKNLMKRCTPSQAKLVFAVCQSVLEQNGEDFARLIHDNFFKRRVDIVYQTEDYRYNLGQIEGGNALLIFQCGAQSYVTDSILANLEESCYRAERRNNQHQNVENASFDDFVKILTKKSTVEHSKPTFHGGVTRSDYYVFIPKGALDDQLEALYRDMTINDNAAMVVLNKLTSNLDSDSDMENIPCCFEWMQFFQTVYGDITDIVVVIIIDYLDFPKCFNVDSKAEIRRMVTRNIPAEMRNQIKCVDVSSDHDLVLEEGSHMRLEIFALEP